MEFLLLLMLSHLEDSHNIAAPAAMIGTSNFLFWQYCCNQSFGLNSGAALATVVGVLVEVPVMLSLVAIVNLKSLLFRRKSTLIVLFNSSR